MSGFLWYLGCALAACLGLYGLGAAMSRNLDGGVRMMMRWQAYTFWVGIAVIFYLHWHPLLVLLLFPLGFVVPNLLLPLRVAILMPFAMRRIKARIASQRDDEI